MIKKNWGQGRPVSFHVRSENKKKSERRKSIPEEETASAKALRQNEMWLVKEQEEVQNG